MVQENLKKIYENIKECKAKSPYNQDVTLVAVSKTKPAELVAEAYEAGQRDFGENKVQEICMKQPLLPHDIRWHMIGHLQTNKVRQVIDKVYMIHSVDSLHLAETINEEAYKKNLIMKILVQVNVSGEESKFGIAPAQTADFIRHLSEMKNIKTEGFMTIAPYTENPEENRRFFHDLKKISIDIGALNIDNISVQHLSMGMSGDYRTAIEEGATIIRVGTSIFGERNYL